MILRSLKRRVRRKLYQHIEQKRLPYTQQEMFDLVSAVDEYKDFAPWCLASRINRWEGETIFYADLVIGYHMFRERFSSKVVLENPERLTIEYQNGPLKHLTNEWRFTDNGDGSCTIDFTVAFEFKNVFLQSLSKRFFNEVVKRMVSSFESRAAHLYAPPVQ